jgi:PAS domain S-box-containing protein
MAGEAEYDNVQCAVVLAQGSAHAPHELTITYVNRHFIQLFGYEARDIVGKEVGCLAYKVVDGERHSEYVRAFCETGVHRVPLGNGRIVDGRHRDGSFLSVKLTLSKLPESKYVAFFSAVPPHTELSSSGSGSVNPTGR